MRLLKCASVLVFVLALAGCRPAGLPGGEGGAMPAATASAPGFALPALSGSETSVSLEALKGKVVLLDFWATWCPPCRHELPYLGKMYTDLKDRGFAIVGMTVDQGPVAEVSEAVKPFGIPYPLVLAGSDVQAAYGGIRAVPTKFLLDKDGGVRKRYVGVVSEAELRADVESLLSM